MAESLDLSWKTVRALLNNKMEDDVTGGYVISEAEHHKIIRERKRSFDAQMFGKLADDEVFLTMSDELQDKLKKLAPDFRPT